MTSSLLAAVTLLAALTIDDCVCESLFFRSALLLSAAEDEQRLHDWQQNHTAVANIVCLTILLGNQFNVAVNRSIARTGLCTWPLYVPLLWGRWALVHVMLLYAHHGIAGRQATDGCEGVSLGLTNTHLISWTCITNGSQSRGLGAALWEIGRLRESDSTYKQSRAESWPKTGEKN